MKILLTNDDGVNAPGIKTLYDALSATHEVIVVAPHHERSVSGHSLSLHNSLYLKKVSKNIYSCSGFPADCVYIGLEEFYKDSKPDLVLSGINRGANLGQDTYYSGTVAAAREGVFQDIHGVAVSLAIDMHKFFEEDNLYYHVAAKYIGDLLENNITNYFGKDVVLNINVPNCSKDKIEGVDITKLGFREYSRDISKRISPFGKEYLWIAGKYIGFKNIPGSDCVTVENNRISVNPINISSEITEQNGKLLEMVNVW